MKETRSLYCGESDNRMSTFQQYSVAPAELASKVRRLAFPFVNFWTSKCGIGMLIDSIEPIV